jgi:hypothetical protein
MTMRFQACKGRFQVKIIGTGLIVGTDAFQAAWAKGLFE